MDERGQHDQHGQQQAWGPPPAQGGQYYAPPTPPVVKARSRWKTPLIALAAFVAGIVIGAAFAGGTTPGSTAAPTATQSSPAAGPSSPGPVKSPAAPPAQAKNVVLQTSGNGQKTTKQFTVAGDWSVRYTYNCASFGMAGNFVVSEHGGEVDGMPIINTSGDKGGDVSYRHGDAGQRSLEVNSECDWTLTVTSGDGG